MIPHKAAQLDFAGAVKIRGSDQGEPNPPRRGWVGEHSAEQLGFLGFEFSVSDNVLILEFGKLGELVGG